LENSREQPPASQGCVDPEPHAFGHGSSKSKSPDANDVMCIRLSFIVESTFHSSSVAFK
jgi:hypothetical protein